MGEGIKLFCCVVVNSFFTELHLEVKTRRIKISLYVAAQCQTPNANTWPQDTLHKAIMQVSFQHWEKQFNKVGKFLQYLPC